MPISSTVGFGFNIDNQLSNAGFNFDAEGSMTAEPSGGLYAGATLTYDPEDRLTGISTAGFTAAYDGDGMRASTTTASGVNRRLKVALRHFRCKRDTYFKDCQLQWQLER